MKRLMGYLTILSTMGLRGIFKTLYLNFRMFPLRIAVRLPVYCSAHTRFFSLKGKIEFDCPVRHGLVKIGFLANDMFVPSNNVANLSINGVLRFKGRGDFAGGVSLNVGRYGTLTLGDEFVINSQVKIVCHERIDIGDWARIAWECQLFDTNFHYIREVATGRHLKKTAPVLIGKNVWIGNRTTVTKGALLPDLCIVGSNSLCNKDYSELPRDSLIAGIPARLDQDRVPPGGVVRGGGAHRKGLRACAVRTAVRVSRVTNFCLQSAGEKPSRRHRSS